MKNWINRKLKIYLKHSKFWNVFSFLLRCVVTVSKLIKISIRGTFELIVFSMYFKPNRFSSSLLVSLQIFLLHCSNSCSVFASLKGVVTAAAATTHDAAHGAFEHTKEIGHALTLLHSFLECFSITCKLAHGGFFHVIFHLWAIFVNWNLVVDADESHVGT